MSEQSTAVAVDEGTATRPQVGMKVRMTPETVINRDTCGAVEDGVIEDTSAFAVLVRVLSGKYAGETVVLELDQVTATLE